jgi:hypothetical protein
MVDEFQGGLVVKAHLLLHHATPGSRVMKKSEEGCAFWIERLGLKVMCLGLGKLTTLPLSPARSRVQSPHTLIPEIART